MTKLNKPNIAFTRLMDALLPGAECIAPAYPGALTAGFCVNNNADFAKMFLLHRGYANIRRRSDNLILSTVFPPYVLGTSYHPGTRIHYIIELGANSCLYQQSRTQAFNIIKREGLYRDWMTIVAYKLALLYEHDSHTLDHDAKDIVFRMLSKLMDCPPDFRAHMPVVRFIEQRTTLSKSCIQRIIVEFKTAGCLDIEDGRLIAMNYRYPLSDHGRFPTTVALH